MLSTNNHRDVRSYSRFPILRTAVATVAMLITAHSAQSANLTWDTTPGDGATITAGSGTWNLTAGNTVWNNAGANVLWSQTNTTTATNSAIFAGADGTYAITVGTALAAQNLTFNNSGYTLSAATAQTLTLNAASPAITMASGKTATIGSNFTVATTSASGNPITIAGAGTLNIIGTGAKIQTGANNISITSGTIVNVGTGGSMISTAQLVIGTTGTTSLLNVDGGSVALNNTGTGNIVIANSGTGTVAASLKITSNGGTVTNTSPTGGLRFGPGTGGVSTVSGTLDLDGGTLMVAKLYEGTGLSTVSMANLNGGTIKALSTTTFGSTFMTGLDFVNVKSGGAKFDSNGANITIAQPLLDGSGGGGLTKLGAGTLTLTGTSTYTGTTDIQAGALSIGASNIIPDANAVQISGGTLDVANAETVGTVTLASGTIAGAAALTGSSYDVRSGTISGNLAGTGALTKSTSGTVTISGNSTYTGSTTVNAGLLNISGSVTSPISVTPTGSLGGEGLSTANLVLGAGSTFVFDPTTTGANQYFKTTGNIDTTAGASTKININVAATVNSGTGIVVFEGGSITTNGLSDFKLGSRGTLSLTPTQLLFDYAAGSVVWKGANGTNPTFWDINTTPQNFTLGGVDDFYFDGDNVTFDDTASSFNVAIQGPQVTPGSVTVNNSTNAYTITGVISGNAPLTKSGTNTLTLVGAQTYTGGTTISGGTLKLGDGTSLGSVTGTITDNGVLIVDAGANNITFANDVSGTGSLTTSGSGTITVTGSNTYNGATTINSGTVALGNGGTIGTIGSGSVTNNGALIINHSDHVSFANNIGGTGSLTKQNGTSVLTLSGTSTYDGVTTISAGGIVAASNSALGSTVGNTAVAPNTALGLNGGITISEPVTGSGVGTLVANTGAFTAVQRGMVQSISGTNTINGAITVSATGLTRLGVQDGATLNLNGPITMGSGVSAVTLLFRGALSGDWINLNSSGNNWDRDTVVFTNAATNPGGLRIGVDNALPTTVSLVAGGVSGGAATTVDLNGFDQTLNGLVISNGKLHIRNFGTSLSSLTLDLTLNQTNTNFSGVAGTTTIEDGPAPDSLTGANQTALVKKGAFTQTLVGDHTWSGPTSIEAGTLALAIVTGNPAIPTTSINPATTIAISSGAKFSLQTGQTHQIAGLTGAGSVVGGNTTTSTLDVNVPAVQTSTFTGVIGDAGANENNINLTKSGDGTLSLSGIHTYTGATTVDGGKLITTAALQNPTAITINNGAILEVPANGSSSAVTSVNSLATNGSGSRLELHDNDLVLNYSTNPSSYTDTVNKVKSGLTLLGGTGTEGITSVEVDAQTISGTVLAVVDDGDPNIGGGITSLSGFTVPNPTTSVLVKYTWFGDANLDGIVDGSDYALTDTGFTSGGALGGWVFGDYDYNGIIDGGDYALQDTGFIAQTGALPEPTALGLLGLGAVSMLRRRRTV